CPFTMYTRLFLLHGDRQALPGSSTRKVAYLVRQLDVPWTDWMLSTFGGVSLLVSQEATTLPEHSTLKGG
ncbi:13405_t:CDS:2, partial [Funneliformis geosporum]